MKFNEHNQINCENASQSSENPVLVITMNVELPVTTNSKLSTLKLFFQYLKKITELHCLRFGYYGYNNT